MYSKMSVLFVVLIIISSVEIFYEAAACSSHLDCNSWDVCCRAPSSVFRRCRKKLYPYSLNRTCAGYYCTKNTDCKGWKNGKKLCCQRNRCTDTCNHCDKHSDCWEGASCCSRAWFQQKKCKFTCVGEYCIENNDCGIGECCRSNRCDYCNNFGCKSDRECTTGQYCCDKDFFPNTKCRRMCFGDSCTSNSDCAWSARCDSNICVERDKCANHGNCSYGLYCCKSNDDNVARCRQSCIGNRCYDDNHCGPNEECCIKNKCRRCGLTCTSSLHCFGGALCCKGAHYRENWCASKCDNESCTVNSLCTKPTDWCVNGVCSPLSSTKPCSSDSDCIAPVDKQYHCCIDKNTGVKSCKSKCQSNVWRLPQWLIGVVIAFVMLGLIIVLCCFCSRRKFLRRRPSDLDVVQNTFSPDNERSGNDNDRNEPSLPSYSVVDRLSSTHNELRVNMTENIPPPPYSFEEQPVFPEHNNEPPPRYRLVHL